jgi:hypothetical protein
MGDRPEQEDVDRGPVGTAISTAMRGNATAFGFSITITGCFGVLQRTVGSPTVGQILMFGVASAATVGAVQALVTRGFRDRPGVAHAEVRMLATAQDFVSVTAGLGTAAGVGALVASGAAWPLGAAAATFVFLAAESAETLLAERIQKARGDAQADEADDDGSG